MDASLALAHLRQRSRLARSCTKVVGGCFIAARSSTGCGGSLSAFRRNTLIIEKLIGEVGGAPGPALAEQLLPATETALRKFRPDEDRVRARVLKSRGICLEAVAELQQVLACYDEALTLDPKVGVKRRADALRRVTYLSSVC
jgi:hypothetical protein